MNDFTLAHRMFDQAVDIKNGRAVALRKQGGSSLARSLDEMAEVFGAPPLTGRRRKQIDPVVPEKEHMDATQELVAARARWDVGDFAGAREIARSAGIRLPWWPKPRIARQMSSEVAAALDWDPDAPEAISAPKKATVVIKPAKWEASRFVPIAGFIHEDVKERDSRREKLLVALIATAARLQRA